MHKITDDESLISLLFARDESALSRLAEKYHTLLLSITRRILPDARDVEECVNDTYIRIWNAIPPEHPVSLPAYLSRVARNLALERPSSIRTGISCIEGLSCSDAASAAQSSRETKSMKTRKSGYQPLFRHSQGRQDAGPV